MILLGDEEMAYIPGNGLPKPNDIQCIQEHITNADTAEGQKDVALLPLTDLERTWFASIKAHYRNLKKGSYNRRDALAEALGAELDIKDGYCRLPKCFPANPEIPLPEKAGEVVSMEEFRSFLAKVSGNSESLFKNEWFDDRKRARNRKKVEDFLRMITTPEKYRELCGSFGFHPEPVTLQERRTTLEKYGKAKWDDFSWGRIANYTMLSVSTMDNVKTVMNQLPATAYHYIIALGDPGDTKQLLELYRVFGLSPVQYEKNGQLCYGEADGIAIPSVAMYDPLCSKMECDVTEFWSTLHTVLRKYDEMSAVKLYAKLFAQPNDYLMYVELPLEV